MPRKSKSQAVDSHSTSTVLEARRRSWTRWNREDRPAAKVVGMLVYVCVCVCGFMREPSLQARIQQRCPGVLAKLMLARSWSALFLTLRAVDQRTASQILNTVHNVRLRLHIVPKAPQRRRLTCIDDMRFKELEAVHAKAVVRT